AGRAWDLRRGRGAGVPAGAAAVPLVGRPRGRGTGGQRRPRRRRAAPRGPAGLHHAIAPVPDRGRDVAGPPGGTARLGATAWRGGRRGRLRQRVPVGRAAAGTVAE